jgi:hypothetical protein
MNDSSSSGAGAKACAMVGSSRHGRVVPQGDVDRQRRGARGAEVLAQDDRLATIDPRAHPQAQLGKAL